MVERFMLLPMNTSLSDDDVHYVCDCIIDFYEGR
jgi:dTDP-4-amino-4,6-dideoxygalactose transaminase